MCFERILHKLFSSVMHQKRLATFIILIHSFLATKSISVTALGRGIDLPIKERSGIRRSDRFIGNKLVQGELKPIYRAFINSNIGSKRRPKILIDWSQIPNTQKYILRAALVGKGRAITLYEELYKEKYLNNPEIEHDFLCTLKELLPENCRPIVITDAGFRVPWFQKVLELNWDYIGRVRGMPQYFDGKIWIKCHDLLAGAKVGFKYLGERLLTKKTALRTHLYLVKQTPKNRKSTRRKPGGKRDELNYKRSGKEAWLLASSLPGGTPRQTKRIVKIYQYRMQIEQTFRDLKNSNFGFCMRDAHSRKPERIRILLLIAMVATWIAWLIGYFLEKKRLHLDFQSNSIKTRRVLSLVYLGCRALKRKVKIPDLCHILAELEI